MASGETGVGRSSTPEQVVAWALCQSWHRLASGGMLTDPSGVTSTFSTVHGPCLEHQGAATLAVRALREAGLLPAADASPQPPV